MESHLVSRWATNPGKCSNRQTRDVGGDEICLPTPGRNHIDLGDMGPETVGVEGDPTPVRGVGGGEVLPTAPLNMGQAAVPLHVIAEETRPVVRP